MTRYKLSEICKIVSGSTPKTNVPEYWDGENVWITPAEITDKTFIVYDSQRKLSNLGVEKTHLSSFPKGTVILSSRAPIGKVAIAGVEMFCNQGFKNLICSEKIMNEYLYWFLKGKTKYLNSLGRGATFKELSAKIIGNIELEVPSIQEQKEVVIRLRKIDQIIGVFEREVELLDELIKARFVEMFGDPVLNEKGWITKPLIDMGNCKNGMNFHYNENGCEVKCLGVGDFKDLSIINNIESLQTVSLNEMPSEEYMLRDNDIVFVRSNGNKALVGRSVVIYPGDVPTTFSGFCIRYRKYDDSIIVPYLLHVLKTESFRNKMVGRGANIQNLNQQILASLIIPVPPLELQNQFASFVEEIDKSRSRIQKSLEASQELFDSLMQEYFG